MRGWVELWESAHTITAAYLRDYSLHERMMLASLVKHQAGGQVGRGVFFLLFIGRQVQHLEHLLYMNVLTSETDPKRNVDASGAALVLDSLVASRAMLVEDGAGVNRTEGERRVLLNLE